MKQFMRPMSRAIRLMVLRRRIRKLVYIYDSIVLYRPKAFYPYGWGGSAIVEWKWVPSPNKNPRISVLYGEVDVTWEEIATMVSDARSALQLKQRSAKSARVPTRPRGA